MGKNTIYKTPVVIIKNFYTKIITDSIVIKWKFTRASTLAESSYNKLNNEQLISRL